MKIQKKHLLFGLAGLAIGLLIGQVVGSALGERAAKSIKSRLETVWPTFMSFPTRDRELLLGLSLTCHLEQRAENAAEVKNCLRDALADPNVLLPNGTTPEAAKGSLDRLINAQGK